MKIKVKPSGANVRDERGRPYPEAGATIEKTVYVARLIRDGSLVVETTKTEKKGGDK